MAKVQQFLCISGDGSRIQVEPCPFGGDLASIKISALSSDGESAIIHLTADSARVMIIHMEALLKRSLK